MLYLIAKYFVLWVLAAVFGFLLGRWWVRRSFVDVTESYETMSKVAAQAPWDRLWSRMDRVEKAVRDIKVPQTPELGELNESLQIIDARLTQMSHSPDPQTGHAPQSQEIDGGPRLLRSAEFGRKDDLKTISGVGPKLERLLNRNGVFYFWQIADWSASDVLTMDHRLEAFKGRIERDDWVRQARGLVDDPRSAPRP